MSQLDNIDPTPIDYTQPAPRDEPDWAELQPLDRALLVIMFGVGLCLVVLILRA